ncbi:putative domain HDIG-containing protein [Acetivibrio clariflavus DSM 19732]|uniref:Putative domain HDIG-containing protein n=2 Tax=Acetivibrio clariflavus TaxID=288965 RepID=G8M1A7_ACECE|nr:putative domain HDIG-containing protein [Acetivibrio clariflavus DSM 19732]
MEAKQFMTKDRNKESYGGVKNYFKDKRIQRIMIAVITVLVAYAIVLNGATPKKYKLKLGEKSEYDITAPRDIKNTILTEQNARRIAEAEAGDMKEIKNASIEVINKTVDFISFIEKYRKNADKKIRETLSTNDENYDSKALNIKKEEATNLNKELEKLEIVLSYDQVLFFVANATDEDIQNFGSLLRELVVDIMGQDVTEDNISQKIVQMQNSILTSNLKQELKNCGLLLSKYLIKPNRTINAEGTRAKKERIYELALNDPNNIVMVKKGDRILSKGDVVTEDKLKILEELNLLETTGKIDFSFAIGIFIIIFLISILLILYMNKFCRKVFNNRNDLILLSLLILIILITARMVFEISTLTIPIFLAAALISILLDLRLAIIVNFLLTISISIMTNGEIKFMILGAISGAFTAFIVSKTSYHRNSLSMGGLIIGIINVLIIISIDLIEKYPLKTIVYESIVVMLNGFLSIVLTIGLLPYLEVAFNIVTPIRLLELSNPNHPLLKRLLIEAPGTYHHSLMVGNLAEAGAEAVGGNALLARVAAYFHDIGKLKRPGFFMENQMDGNPHDKITANLSTLVITSHIHDGVEIAKRYRIPQVIRDIIIQHHGTTLVAYFYHKAKNVEKDDSVDEENFRYDGEKPSTKEAAVVMLADSVEAAVRSMPDKTEGKIEGFIRKIIKDKLDDGQLDQCNLTFKDLDNIAKAFMKVFGGYFHAREEYPDIKNKDNVSNNENDLKINEQNSNDSHEETNFRDTIEETKGQIAAHYNNKTHKEKSE